MPSHLKNDITAAAEEISVSLISYETESTDSTPLLPTTSAILYLAYGSNLCSETFRGTRGIKPLSSQAVHVPSLTLTFDLAGLPYVEPCFANTSRTPPPANSPYHKDHWPHGLIGVVYEVTPLDYRTIIATEGGGASYQDVLVDCHALSSSAPTLSAGLSSAGKVFQAHTLLAPLDPTKGVVRKNPSYAQPSARYLNLLTTGAEEHALPEDYKTYLREIRPFRITTVRQKFGKAAFVGLCMPIVFLVFGLGRVFADKEGRVPAWLGALMGWVFKVVWAVYDGVFKRVFGEGERTIEDCVDCVDVGRGRGLWGFGMGREKRCERVGDEEVGVLRV